MPLELAVARFLLDGVSSSSSICGLLRESKYIEVEGTREECKVAKQFQLADYQFAVHPNRAIILLVV